MTRGDEARRLVRKFASGVLATQSLKFPGYPYASSLPFCTDQRGRIVVLISHLAEHTQNADHDTKAGFLVSPLTRDLQEQARVSMIGDIAPVDDAAMQSRYLRFFPEARQYLQIGGFRVVFIRGPGERRRSVRMPRVDVGMRGDQRHDCLTVLIFDCVNQPYIAGRRDKRQQQNDR